MKIHYFPQDLVFQKVADFLMNLLEENREKKTLVLLSGGSAVKIYERISNYELRITNLAIAQIDERFQPEKEEDINAIVIGKTRLWEICRKKNIPYYLISQEGSLEESANKYNEQIKDLFEHFSFKIGVLGIGEDGHTAGLIPGYEKSWNVEKHVVGYDLGQNNPRGLFCQQDFRQRITVTSKALKLLDQTIVVAVGEEKKEALRKLKDMKLKDIDKYPAVILRKIKKVDLFTDIKIPEV